MAKFTAGPWHLSPSGRYIRYGDNPPHGPNLADTDCFGGPLGEGVANAKLIVAAPDLLAACKEALKMCEANGYGRDSMQSQLRDALTKAEDK